jgi:hypothetical protein
VEVEVTREKRKREYLKERFANEPMIFTNHHKNRVNYRNDGRRLGAEIYFWKQ